jgi:hypothetical protein
MATLRMPDRLARELVTYCISAAAPTSRSDDLLRMVISALGELPVESAHISTEVDADSRHADVVVAMEYAPQLAALFPGAARLGEQPGGTSAFRLEGSPQTGHTNR